MFRFIIKIILDLVRLYVPLNKQSDGYAFIVHPRDYGDIISNVRFLKYFPRPMVEKFFPMLWPFTVSGMYGLKSKITGQPMPGWVIGVPLFAHQLLENKELARKKINQAIRLARNKGAKVVGLGAMTGSIMEHGAGLSSQDSVAVTAGRAYTSFVVKAYADDVINKLNLKKENLTIAVVGAAGGVGIAVSRLLINEPYAKIWLIDLERKLDAVREIHRGIESGRVEISHQIGNVKYADIIITATNAPEAVLQSDDIKPGAVIIDDAQPSDISPDVIKTRDDIIVIEAGVIASTEKLKIGTNFRLANNNEIYCCLGEVMAIAAFDYAKQYEPKNIPRPIIEEIADMAKQLGFSLAPYQAFGRVVEEARIHHVRSNIIRNR